MPLQATSGAASYDAFGGGVPVVPNYIEDVFSTWLYTGNGSSQTITNGIDLSGKGGLVWFKRRSTAISHALFDSARSSTSNALFTNTSGAQVSSYGVTFNSNGVSLGQSEPEHNSNGETYVSWTFRKQPKFFDVVTYSGNSVSGRQIAHNLGSAPGCIIVKSTNLAGTNWAVWHRSLATGFALQLQGTNAAFSTKPQWFNSSTQGSSTTFEVGNDTDTNETGNTYVAYLFAHNAGGFGLSGTDNVISCGSYTGNGSATGPVVTLGYEPQWVMVKRTDSTSNWTMFDTMRGMSQTSANLLYANLADDEGIGTQGWVVPNATGFQLAITQSSVNASGGTYIYIAIRRGPMRTPTTGTSVFSPNLVTSDSNPITTGFPVDMFIDTRNNAAANRNVFDRLRGGGIRLFTNLTDLEDNIGLTTQMQSNTSVTPGVFGNSSIVWSFRRAPSVFDVVCYRGTNANRTINHNLTVIPELIIVKDRSQAQDWQVYSAATGATNALRLNQTDASFAASTYWNNTTPTSSVFTVGTSSDVNSNGNNFVAYLFASCPGVSKVGSFTGTGATQVINCGFTGGARFVLIKATSTTGNWLVWDSARGIVAGNDPYLVLNNSNAEITNTDWVDTAATGFELSNAGGNLANSNGVSYIFLAIA